MPHRLASLAHRLGRRARSLVRQALRQGLRQPTLRRAWRAIGPQPRGPVIVYDPPQAQVERTPSHLYGWAVGKTGFAP